MGINSGFGISLFSIIPVIIIIGFVVILVTMIAGGIKGLGQWSKNNSQPVLAVPARIISKRTDVSSHMHTSSDSFQHSHVTTRYYVTFEVETGSRMEFKIEGSQFGLLTEGDSGKLTFQGTRFLGFDR